MDDQAEQIKLLSYELARVRDTLNYFMDPLTHSIYPVRDHRVYQPATRFKAGSDEALFQIFKIIDYEVRRLHEAALAAGVDLNEINTDYMRVFDQLSAATGITENSHTD